MGPMNVVPLDDVAYAAALLIIKAPFGSREVRCGPGARSSIMAAEHERIQLEEKLEVTHDEQVEALGEQAVHKTITSHHICHDAGVHRVAAGLERLIYLWKLRL